MELLKNRKNLNILWKHLNCPIIWLSRDFQILEINKAALKVYQWTQRDVLGKNYSQFCKKENFPCPLSKNKSKLLANKCVRNIETIITNKDKEHIVLWKIDHTFDKNNNQNGYILIGEDVTKLRKEEEKSFQLDNIIAKMPNSVYWYDENCTYLGCNNNAAKHILGIPRKQVAGKNFRDFSGKFNWSKQFLDDLSNEAKSILSTGIADSNKEEFPFQTAEGKTIYQLSNKVPLSDKKGKPYAILGISVDITERKKLELALIEAKEKAEEANASKASFIAVMSHEFRTPLNSIFGIAQDLAKQKNLTVTQKKQLKVLLFSGDHLIGLINDVLDFSKLEAGKLTLEFEKFDLRQLVKDSTTSLQHMVEDKPVRLLAEYSEKAPHMVVADPRRVRQIVINFINNAVKFTDEGHVIAKVNTCDNGKKLLVSVEDTGIGIPKNKISTVFERFSQVETNKYNRNYGGTGLGLAICKQLVENMNGTIGVKTKFDKGSTFWFKIPLDLKATVVRKAKEKTNLDNILENDDTPLDKPCYILLIEDNVMNQMVAQLVMDDLGCTYDMASSGPEGIKLFKKNNYDIIFTDISMPKMNGIEVMQAIRKQKRGKTVPLVAMTAHVMDEDRDACMEAGANDVLEKPILFPSFKALVRKWLK